MMRKYSFFIVILSTILTSNGFTQSTEEHHNHEHHKNEIGVANSLVYILGEKAYAYGLHMHYVRNIPKSKFGIGLGYERIFSGHNHNTLGIVGAYRPIEGLSFNVSPGVTFGSENHGASFALHLETAYEFEIKNIHLGPAFEFAYDPEDMHISLGIHIGYGF